jgi:hypothetical protein
LTARGDDQMATEDDSTDQPSDDPANPAKAEKIARQRARLLEDVAASATQDLKGKVGYTLTHYPDTRDSDRVLVDRLLTTPQFRSQRPRLDP